MHSKKIYMDIYLIYHLQKKKKNGGWTILYSLSMYAGIYWYKFDRRGRARRVTCPAPWKLKNMGAPMDNLTHKKMKNKKIVRRPHIVSKETDLRDPQFSMRRN